MLELNLLLAIFALGTAILAIAGDTWDKSAQGAKKVTPRGWAAVLLALATFLTGGVKERLAAESDKKMSADAEHLRKTADNQYVEILALRGRIDQLYADATEAAKERDRAAAERAAQKQTETRARELVNWINDGLSAEKRANPYDRLMHRLTNTEDRNSPITKADLKVLEQVGKARIDEMGR